MSQMNFGVKWRNWILGCLSSSYASVLINGSPTKEFRISKGVRQGDPLSPFLFIIAMEGLNIAMRTACENGRFVGKRIGRSGPMVSHLFYADDALFVGEACDENMKNLARILKCFNAASGLQVNFHKSQVYGIGVESSRYSNWARFLGCISGSLPFKYLGVPIGENMNLKKSWTPIVNRFSSRLSEWKAKHLSFGGRLTLIKSVLSSLPLYYFSLFKAPECIIEKLEQIRRRFLWGSIDNGKKICWVAWSTVLASKEKGGLGVGSLKAQNIALLMKWWWKFRENGSSIWKDAICAIHKLHRKPMREMAGRGRSGVWNNINTVSSDLYKIGLNFDSFFSIKIGDGKNVSFWKDIWCGDTSLQSTFPSLFSTESSKNCLINERIGDNCFDWKWAQNPCGQGYLKEFCDLLHLLSSVTLNVHEDRLIANNSSDSSYKVCVSRRMIYGTISSNGFNEMIWIKSVPLKINCFVWRVGMGRIPVSKSLVDRGINVGAINCKVCNLDVEDVDHVFIKCSRSIDTRRLVFDWCGITLPHFNSVIELIDFGAKWGNTKKVKKVLLAIIYGLLWSMWKARNDMVFNNKAKSHTIIADEVITNTFLWLKHRGKLSCSLASWNVNPFSCIM